MSKRRTHSPEITARVAIVAMLALIGGSYCKSALNLARHVCLLAVA